MKRYSKGARGERELLNFLYSKGYSVMRAAGSGVNSLGPDIIAFREGTGLAFECKAWEKTSLSIEAEKIEKLRQWQENTKMHTFIAWRMNGNGWFFISLEELKKTPEYYTVTRRNAISINRKIANIMDIK
ncbi:Resolvase, Holliday junction-type [mine drainage metagenome]|uniref:Resolvase, Holliday junction-type n=1 Tax=mine drainage metagenome TaxID=410659 RepID=T1B8A2_9ZZZZ